MAVLTQAEFDDKYEGLFADNEFRNITEGTFRTLKDDIKDSFVNLKSLTVKQVRGAVYPVPYTDNLNLIPAEYRILGMEAVARNGTDSATGGAGVIQPPITYQLIRDSAGDINALVDEQPDTVATVKARWVRTSGTAQEQADSFPSFEQEDRSPSYQPGDRFSYEFPSGILRLAQVKVAQGNLAATPTGEDDDPNYAYFAPLASGGGTLSDADVKAAYERNANTNAYTDSEKTKLAGIAVGATANATDAQLRDRSTHTGAQPISSITNLQPTLDAKQAVEVYATLLYAASVTLDFAGQVGLLTLAGDVSFTTANRALGRRYRLFVTADATTRTLTFPASWVWYGTKPTTLAAGKEGVLTLECLGSTSSQVRAAWAAQS